MNTRTTIILPEKLLKQAKIHAVHQKKGLSALVREAIEEKINPQIKKKASKKALSLLGKYSLGITSTLRREEIYADHLRHKMSHR